MAGINDDAILGDRGQPRQGRYDGPVNTEGGTDSAGSFDPSTEGLDANVPAPGIIHRLLGDERVRFVLVGGFNTFFGYGIFVALEYLAHIPYLASLYGSYLLATTVAFVLHRRVTYRRTGTGNVLLDFVRFQGVYVVALAVNTAALPLLVEVAHWTPTVAQGLIVVVTSVMSYFGHKFFSFRRPAAT